MPHRICCGAQAWPHAFPAAERAVPHGFMNSEWVCRFSGNQAVQRRFDSRADSIEERTQLTVHVQTRTVRRAVVLNCFSEGSRLSVPPVRVSYDKSAIA